MNKKGDNGEKSDEEALWLTAMKDVAPLPSEDRNSKNRPYSHAKTESRSGLDISAPPLPDGETSPQGLPGLDRRTEDRLRRGKMPIEARLDLHGMTQDQAKEALSEFIAEFYSAGRRCILVITGRGRPDAPGVLRARLPQWLAEPPLAGVILRAVPAQPQHGGQGAFYVLLRRQR